MRVKRDPSPWIKLRDSLLPTGWTHVSAFRHLIHLHRLNGMLRDAAACRDKWDVFYFIWCGLAL
jgi:hypothetical protein